MPFSLDSGRPGPPPLPFVFPTTCCCNCGSTADLRVIVQDTRLTRYFVFVGYETRFSIPLPFCSVCVPTATRRRPTLVDRAIVFGFLFFGTLALFFLLGFLFDSQWLLEHTLLFSTLFGIAGFAVFYSSRRRAPGQTSYYQPVWIGRYRQPFLSMPGRGIALAFSHAAYARLVEAANGEAVANGKLQVQSALATPSTPR